MKSINEDINACIINQFTVNGVLYEIDAADRDPVDDVPHCHVINENGFECCVRLDVPEYFIHGEYTDMFPSKKVVDAFYESMKTLPDGVILPIEFKNSWEIAIWSWDFWNKAVVYSERGVPDYSKLGFSE